MRGRRRVGAALLAVTAVGALLAGCSTKPAPDAGDDFGAADCTNECVVVDVAMSPEKNDLLTDLAKSFNASQPKVGNTRIVVQPKSKSSGAAMQLLASDWPDAEGPKPVIWSPASSAWGAVLDQKLSTQGKKAMAGQGTPFMNTPLVIAMPKPMAEALGWPGKELGWQDLFDLTTNPQGWAAFGHPEWGPFRLGKTNPNFSTSGLHAFVAQNYAATGKTRDLTTEDLAKPEVVQFDKTIESAVVHYGDTTLTFLNNWYRADQRGNPFTYASAVAVEEKSVIDYNTGNPDGVLSPGEEPRKPRVPLVAIYPKEGTLFSDNPFFILDAPWVSGVQKDGAKLFQDYVQKPENQQRVLQFNFRPGNPQVAIAAPITKDNGVDPDQPRKTMQMPPPPVMTALLDTWGQLRKPARVMLVMDVSGSMGDDAGNGSTKLDLAKQAAISSLDQFKPEDEVGLRIFTTGLGGNGSYVDLVPIAPISAQREQLFNKINGLYPQQGTPLYTVTQASVQDMLSGYDAQRINAVVLLTDGRNEDDNRSDDRSQLSQLTSFLQDQTQGENGRPVRLFTIGYGTDVDKDILKQLAEATNANAYTASDPTTINKVFTQVVSNF